MTDDDIDTSDIPPLTEEFWKNVKWRTPILVDAKVQVDLPLKRQAERTEPPSGLNGR